VRTIYEGLADQDLGDDEASGKFKEFLLNSQDRMLADSLQISGIRIKHLSSNAIWGRKKWAAIIEAAESVGADIIVKSSTSADGRTLARTPDDWNLLRNSRIPVLLCGSADWPDKMNMIAAVDIFDDAHSALNLRILRLAEGLSKGLKSMLKVISAFPSLGPWTGQFSTVLNYQDMMGKVEQDAARRLEALLQGLGMSQQQGSVVEGNTEAVIKAAIADHHADLLLLGTSARKGIESIVIGNTAEQLLQESQIDVLTVP
jgi:universal stress protein E